MKILFFSSYFYPYTSGLTTYPLKILTYLAKKNDTTVLTFPYNNKVSSQVIHNQLAINRMPYLFKISKGFISPQSLIYFYKYGRKTDLIILNQPNFEGLFLAVFGKLFNKKIISIFHCQVFLTDNFFNRIINFFLNLSMKLQLTFSNKIVAYTEDYFDSLGDLKQFRKKTVFTLPPIDRIKSDTRLLKRLLEIKKNNIWIGYAGRIASEKGLEYLIEAVRSIVIPVKAGIQVVFAGPYGKDVVGEKKYYQKIKNLLQQYKIKYHFFGNLSNGNLSAFYKTINLLVLPSTNQTEAFGMVQAEAMLLGTPVIASNLPGVRMPIKLTKMGIIVQSKNSQQLSKAIINVLKNKNKFSNEILINQAKKIFNINKTYRFYEKLITFRLF
jgi:glycosyltransferase involved in cell wall biosynthesis